MDEYNKSLILAKEKVARIGRDERHKQGDDKKIPPGQNVTDR